MGVLSLDGNSKLHSHMKQCSHDCMCVCSSAFVCLCVYTRYCMIITRDLYDEPGLLRNIENGSRERLMDSGSQMFH